jgi:hypothetical protein
VAALLQGVGATQGSRNRAAVELRTLAGDMAREALGKEPPPVRLPPPRAGIAAANLLANRTPHNGKSGLIDHDDDPPGNVTGTPESDDSGVESGAAA